MNAFTCCHQTAGGSIAEKLSSKKHAHLYQPRSQSIRKCVGTSLSSVVVSSLWRVDDGDKKAGTRRQTSLVAHHMRGFTRTKIQKAHQTSLQTFTRQGRRAVRPVHAGKTNQDADELNFENSNLPVVSTIIAENLTAGKPPGDSSSPTTEEDLLQECFPSSNNSNMAVITVDEQQQQQQQQRINVNTVGHRRGNQQSFESRETVPQSKLSKTSRPRTNREDLRQRLAASVAETGLESASLAETGLKSTSIAEAGLKEETGLKEVLTFCIPALGALLADPLMSLADTICVGQVSLLGLAALGPNTAIFAFINQVEMK
jgi:hypothetical protein